MKSYDEFYFYKFIARNNISPEKELKRNLHMNHAVKSSKSV